MIDLFESLIKMYIVNIISEYVNKNKLSDAAKCLLAQSVSLKFVGGIRDDWAKSKLLRARLPSRYYNAIKLLQTQIADCYLQPQKNSNKLLIMWRQYDTH
jgi:hypothetical protein